MSAVPPPYNRQATFTNFSTEPDPTVGQDLEAEFNAIKKSQDATQRRLAEIQRDDGKLRNLSVHPDALSNAVRAILAYDDGKIRGAWVTGSVYNLRDVIEGPDGITYVAAYQHVANVSFAVDLNAGRWLAIDSGRALDAKLRADMADVSAPNGASLIGYLPGTTVRDRLDAIGNLRADLASPNGAAIVMYTQTGVGAVPRPVEDGLRDSISPREYGAKCDGITDDTAHVRAAHVQANALGVSVSYEGISIIAIQANAQIPINTDVDFHGCELVVLGGVNTPPQFSTLNQMFLVSDPSCPLVTLTGVTTADSLRKGSFYPTKGIFNGHGYAEVSCAFQVPDRAEINTIDYRQSFKVNRNARVSNPLSVDLSAYASALNVKYRKTSKRRIVLSRPTIIEGAWNNQIIFEIQRCNVEVSDVSFLFNDPGTPFDNVDMIVRVTKASDVAINRFVTTARQVTTGEGSYCLGIDGGADIYVDGLNALSGWGATGCNNLNGLYVTRSIVNRIDCHESAHNIFVENSDIHADGIYYGWGGGVLSVKGCRLWNSPAIRARADYSGQFFGSMVVDSVEICTDPEIGMQVVQVVALASGGSLGASVPIYAPETIAVSNVTAVGRSQNLAQFEVIPVSLQVKNSSSVVYAPTTIVVDGVRGFTPWRIGMRIDVANMEANPSGQPLTLHMLNCPATLTSPGLSNGIIDFDPIRTPSAKVSIKFRARNVENLAVRMRNQGGLDADIQGCSINVFRPDTAVVQPTIVYRGCKFTQPDPGSGPNYPVAGGVSPPLGYSAMFDCEFSADTWNLANVSALHGCLIRTGGSAPILPTGVTNALAFDGWRRAAVFP